MNNIEPGTQCAWQGHVVTVTSMPWRGANAEFVWIELLDGHRYPVAVSNLEQVQAKREGE